MLDVNTTSMAAALENLESATAELGDASLPPAVAASKVLEFLRSRSVAKVSSMLPQG